jgi:ComF family protein
LGRELLRRFKYQGEYHLRVVLASLLEPALNDPRIAAQGDWVLVPVPLHPRRRREREFNQAAEISRIAGARFGIENIDALKRVRYTTQQAHLDRRERLSNLQGAFQLRDRRARLKGRNVLLVDDVFTTGATVHECAAVLREKAAPAKVAAVTVARG